MGPSGRVAGCTLRAPQQRVPHNSVPLHAVLSATCLSRVVTEGKGDCARHSAGYALGYARSSGVHKPFACAEAGALPPAAAAILPNAPASWQVGYSASAWSAACSRASTPGQAIGAIGLRALACACQRDIVLLNGVPGTTTCQSALFYANQDWAGEATVFDA